MERTNMKGITINNIELRVFPKNEYHPYAAEILCWYPNVYYNRKSEFIQDQLNPEYYIDPNGSAGRIHEGCFLHPKSCYVVAFVTKGDEPDIVSVCGRPWELNEQNKEDFEKVIKHIFEYDPDDDEY